MKKQKSENTNFKPPSHFKGFIAMNKRAACISDLYLNTKGGKTIKTKQAKVMMIRVEAKY